MRSAVVVLMALVALAAAASPGEQLLAAAMPFSDAATALFASRSAGTAVQPRQGACNFPSNGASQLSSCVQALGPCIQGSGSSTSVACNCLTSYWSCVQSAFPGLCPCLQANSQWQAVATALQSAQAQCAPVCGSGNTACSFCGGGSGGGGTVPPGTTSGSNYRPWVYRVNFNAFQASLNELIAAIAQLLGIPQQYVIVTQNSKRQTTTTTITSVTVTIMSTPTTSAADLARNFQNSIGNSLVVAGKSVTVTSVTLQSAAAALKVAVGVVALVVVAALAL